MTKEGRPFYNVWIWDSARLFAAKYGEKITLAEVETIGARLGSLLWSFGAILGLSSRVHVTFKDCEAEGIEYMGDQDKGLRAVHYCLPKSLVLDTADVEGLFIKALCSIVRAIAKAESVDTVMIDRCEALLLSQRNKIKILYKKYETKEYFVEVYFSLLESHFDFRQVYLRLIDKTVKSEGYYLIAELRDDEMFYLIGKVSIKRGLVTVLPKKSANADSYAKRYQARGLILPLTTTVDKIFDNQ
jgi:hypothetical protein